jgi:hypothetical protein
LDIYYFSSLLTFSMILIDFFTEACCKGTELIEGWYWYEDDGERVGGPFEDEEDAKLAAESGITWANAK